MLKAKDVLSQRDYDILHHHFYRDELSYMETDGKYGAYKGYTEEMLDKESLNIATRIMDSPLSELYGYDLFHTLGYNEEYLYIVEKISDIVCVGVGDRVRFKTNLSFDYGLVARQGEVDVVYRIDEEGYWLKEKEIYITKCELLTYVDKVAFKRVDNLYGHSNFEDFEKEFDDEIVYADGDRGSVEDALMEPVNWESEENLYQMHPYLELYEFDGWFIAI